MSIHVVPAQIGEWYLRTVSGERFRVVGVDDRSRTIEIQSSEGDLDELDAEDWSALRLTRFPNSEGWPGPVDDSGACDPCELADQSFSPADGLALLQSDGVTIGRV